MKKRRRFPTKRQSSRRWHIPPPLIHGSENLEGGGILQDFPDPAGVLLWQAFRDSLLWATTEPELRDRLFARESGWRPTGHFTAEADVRAREALAVLEQLVASPATAREDQVSRACRLLSDWAYDQGKLQTALAFAQNSALAGGSNPAAAYWAASVAFRVNDHARAESWFRRAVGLARQNADWRMYSRSFSGLGNLYIRRGNLPAARRLHTRALRGARRGGMRREQASALHDLFAVAVETGNAAEAERLARQALEAFGARNRRLHILAHDVAYFWMEQGHFGRSLAVFQSVLPLVEHRVERVLVLANIVRAAGGVGDRQAVEDASGKVRRYLQQPELRIAAGRSLLEVARGYFTLGEFGKAEQAALGALGSAVEFKENKVQFQAEALLGAIRERSTAITHPRKTEPHLSENTGDELAADFVRSLDVLAGAAF